MMMGEGRTMKERYFSAQEAANELEVSLETLYAYVSRGLVRSEATGGSRRNRRYLAEDVLRLKERKELRHHPEKIVGQALHWGTPLLDSAITLIANGRLYFRGQDAFHLATTSTVEQVAELIWSATDTPHSKQLFQGQQLPATLTPLIEAFLAQDFARRQSPLEQFQALLPLIANEDLAAYNPQLEAMALTGARILQLFTSIITSTPPQATIAQTLQQFLVPEDQQAASILNTALILNADNELSISTFTARCVASTGATLYSVVQAALAALQGVHYGCQIEQIYHLMSEIKQPEQARRVLATRLKQGGKIIGFGQPLFPEGDPRASMLLNLLYTNYPERSATRMVQNFAREVNDSLHEYPNIDFAYAALAHVLGFSSEQALALFALGRCVGWIGHAIEQYQAEQPIRPRARYTGILPT